MRKIFKLSTLMLIVGFLFSAGCSKKDDDGGNNNGGNNSEQTLPDPLGTVLVNMLNENNGKSYVDLSLSPLTCIYIDKANNFYEYYGEGAWINVGKVKGLAEVTKITINGWGNRAAVEQGNGYILLHNDLYFRLYVVEVTGVGAKVKYQGPFMPNF